MYTVTAKTEATGPDLPGRDVKWTVGQSREVHEDCISFYLNNPAAWDVQADATARVVRNQLTGGIELSLTAAAKLRVFVSPSGDATGVTDTASIQAAIDYAYGLGGGRITLLDGLFQVAANQSSGSTFFALRLKDNVQLCGYGRGATTVKVVATAHAGGYPGHVVYAEGVTNISVFDLTIDGNRGAFPSPPFATAIDGECGNGVRYRNAVSALVENCEIKACTYHGVLAVDTSSDVSIVGNRIIDCGYRAVHYNTSGSPLLVGGRVINNYCYGNGAAADNATNSGIFIALNNTREIVVSGNHIEAEKNFAIELSGGAGSEKSQLIAIVGNTVRNCPRGIDITTSAARIAVTSNVLSGTTPAAGSSLRGIGLTAVTNVTVQGNVVTRFGYGVGLSTVCSGVEIGGNVLDDNSTVGIYLSNHAHLAVGLIGNTIRNTGVTAASVNSQGIYIEGTIKQVRLIGNHVENTKGHAILLSNLSDSIVADNVLSNNYDGVGTRGRGIALLNTSDRVAVRGNNITNDGVSNNQNAIYVAGTTTNISVIENHAETSAATKIQVDTGATGRCYGNTGGTFSFPVGFMTGSAAL